MSEPIDLTAAQRGILANQELILAKLYPEERVEHENAAQVYQCGYQLEYREVLGVYDETPASICREVLDIMTMFEFLQLSYDNLADKSGIDEDHVVFRGFDGNNEGEHLSYACFYCKSKKRFGHLRFGSGKIGDQFDSDWGVSLNSHFPGLEGYRQMLELWTVFQKAHRGDRWGNMSKEEIVEILDPAVHPSNR